MNDGNRKSFLTLCLGLLLAGTITGCSSGPNPSKTADGTKRPEVKESTDPFDRASSTEINARTHFAAGQMAEGQDALPRAIDQYKKALEKDPNQVDALFRLGVVYAKLHQYAEAISIWNRYIQATGGDAGAYGNLGFCYELAGRTDEAEAAYLKGIHKDPSNAPSRVNYGLMLARHGRINEATLQLQTVMGEPEVHYNLASVYEWMGRKEQAKVEYRKALELEPTLREAQARLDAIP